MLCLISQLRWNEPRKLGIEIAYRYDSPKIRSHCPPANHEGKPQDGGILLLDPHEPQDRFDLQEEAYRLSAEY